MFPSFSKYLWISWYQRSAKILFMKTLKRFSDLFRVSVSIRDKFVWQDNSIIETQCLCKCFGDYIFEQLWTCNWAWRLSLYRKLFPTRWFSSTLCDACDTMLIRIISRMGQTEGLYWSAEESAYLQELSPLDSFGRSVNHLWNTTRVMKRYTKNIMYNFDLTRDFEQLINWTQINMNI